MNNSHQRLCLLSLSTARQVLLLRRITTISLEQFPGFVNTRWEDNFLPYNLRNYNDKRQTTLLCYPKMIAFLFVATVVVHLVVITISVLLSSYYHVFFKSLKAANSNLIGLASAKLTKTDG